MEKTESYFWYKVTVDYNPPLLHIVQAHDLQEVEDFFELGLFDYHVLRLSWEAISKLTGCVIPCWSTPSASATGNLMFRRYGELFMLISIDKSGE